MTEHARTTTIANASISDCGRYRYTLSRRWRDGDALLWVMLNPSTADASEDDPTIRRCVGFAHGFGFPAIEVVNLFALRATNPTDLLLADDPVGPRNIDVLTHRLHYSPTVIVAWGGWFDGLSIASASSIPRMDNLLAAEAEQRTIYCLGTTKAGAPRHPLYLGGSTQMRRWWPDGEPSTNGSSTAGES